MLCLLFDHVSTSSHFGLALNFSWLKAIHGLTHCISATDSVYFPIQSPVSEDLLEPADPCLSSALYHRS